LTVAQGSARTLFAPINIDNTTGKLDLTDNDLIIDYPGDSSDGPLAELRDDLHDGALFTSVGGATHRLGYADNGVLELPSFSGQTIPPGDYTQLLVKYTYSGDANLDGKVDVLDLGALATHWQQSAPWTGGDFDYNGSVDVNDLGLLASNWQAGVTAVAKPTDGYPWAFANALAALGLPNVAVPEPATLGLSVVGLFMLVGRRRRMRRR
jgi:hypothetical protein